MISFFSNTHNGKLAWKSGIPYRLAPATKWVQILYNHRLTQRRHAQKNLKQNTIKIWLERS